MTRYSIEPRTIKYVKGCENLSFARTLSDKYGNKLLDTNTKTELDAAKIKSKKEVHKTAAATGELIGNKIAGKIVKPDENARNVDEINKPPEKKEKINELRKIIKWNIIKYLHY